MDGLVVVNIFLLVLFLLLDCFLLHVIQAHDGVHQFVYGGGLVIGVVTRVRVGLGSSGMGVYGSC